MVNLNSLSLAFALRQMISQIVRRIGSKFVFSLIMMASIRIEGALKQIIKQVNAPQSYVLPQAGDQK